MVLFIAIISLRLITHLYFRSPLPILSPALGVTVCSWLCLDAGVHTDVAGFHIFAQHAPKIETFLRSWVECIVVLMKFQSFLQSGHLNSKIVSRRFAFAENHKDTMSINLAVLLHSNCS